MTWTRLDDSILTHPKVSCLSDAAGWLWARSLVYANKHLTDGVLRAGPLRVLRAKKSAIKELIDAGLWELDEEKVIHIHDFAD